MNDSCSTTIGGRFAGALFLVSFVIAPVQDAWAHGGGGDIAVFATDGQADVGFAVLDDDDITQVYFDPDDSVFQAILIPLVDVPPFIPYEVGSSEPGYDANEGDLPPLAELRMDTLALWYWDGIGTVNLTPAAGVNAGYAPQPLRTDEYGGFHSHPVFGLQDLTADPLPVADGVYVAQMGLRVTGLEDSDPYYLVALLDTAISNSAAPAETAETVGALVRDYLEDPLANPEPVYGGVDYTYYAEAITYVKGLAAIPEPAGGILAAMALAGLFAGWRRKLTN